MTVVMRVHDRGMLVLVLLVIHDLLLDHGTALTHRALLLARLVTVAAAYDVPNAVSLCSQSLLHSGASSVRVP
jgi:hypothetical protein